MKTYQFLCAAYVTDTGTDWDGYLPLASAPGLITPPVKADTPSEAMLSPEVKAYCEENQCTVFELVRSWAG